MIVDFIREAWTLAKQKRKTAKEKAERAAVAKAFNNVFTYRYRWDTSTDDRIEKGSAMYGIMPKKGYAWMCPECNKIHIADECSVMSGLQYPRCCNTGNGNRLYHSIRTQ
jgi:hypothetical protein